MDDGWPAQLVGIATRDCALDAAFYLGGSAVWVGLQSVGGVRLFFVYGDDGGGLALAKPQYSLGTFLWGKTAIGAAGLADSSARQESSVMEMGVPSFRLATRAATPLALTEQLAGLAE